MDVTDAKFIKALQALNDCRRFTGSASEFWKCLAQGMAQFPTARSSRILTEASDGWRILAQSSSARHFLSREDLQLLAEQAREQGSASKSQNGVRAIWIHFSLTSDLSIYGEILFEDSEQLEQQIDFLHQTLFEIPLEYEKSQGQVKIQSQLNDNARALEILGAVNNHSKFTPAVMTLVNEIADRFSVSRVFLGWVENYYVKTCAMNSTDHFESKGEIIQRLEAAMEECRDQEEEIIYPRPSGNESIVRSHESYAQNAHIQTVVSIPLQVNDEICAVLTLEREKGEFTSEELLSLRVITDQVAPVLEKLKHWDYWFGKRLAIYWKDVFSKWVGPRHTWLKVGAISLSLFLAFALFVPYQYRVKANFIVEPESLALLPVPFNGYIDEVFHKPGDLVLEGLPLWSMERGELFVEEVRAKADLKRYLAEAELAEARNEMGNYRVAVELAGQAEARLQLAQYRLSRAVVVAPFTGVLIEGELRERLGAPVQQGEVLMRFSELESLFLKINLPERDIDLLDDSKKGQVAFASRPDLKFPLIIERIEPSAVAGEGENYFVVRADLLEIEADWLRPGMTGVAKLDAGNRTLAWRATHRLIDFIRLFFWI